MKKIRLPEMIDTFRKQNGWTMKEFGEKMNKSESAISKWIKGVRSPMVDDFDKMVTLFDTDPDTLMYGAKEATILSEINKISEKLEEHRQKIVLSTANNQLSEQIQEKQKESKVIPINKITDDLPPYISRKILENFVMPENSMEYDADEELVDIPILGHIAAGLPLDVVENFDGSRPVPLSFLSSAREYYWLLVEGHSMEPQIPFGAYVLIETASDVPDGTIGAVLFQEDSQATLKKIYHEPDCLRLVSVNKAFKDQYATNSNPAAIIGKAVKIEVDL